MAGRIAVSDLVVGYRSGATRSEGTDGALLPPVSFALESGTLWMLLGRNGAGKSTLCQTILGLQKPVGSHGKVDVEGRLAYVPQHSQVMRDTPLTVAEFVRWAALGSGGQLPTDAEVRASLDEVGMASAMYERFGQLSVGQQKRVQLARVRLQRADIVILDEPLAGLDAVAEAAVWKLMEGMRAAGCGLLLVTHQPFVHAGSATGGIYLDRERQDVCVGPLEIVAHCAGFREQFGHAHWDLADD